MLAQIIAFFQAHQNALAAVVVAILDFAIEIHPSLNGNNIVSLILNFFKSKETPPSPPPAA